MAENNSNSFISFPAFDNDFDFFADDDLREFHINILRKM